MGRSGGTYGTCTIMRVEWLVHVIMVIMPCMLIDLHSLIFLVVVVVLGGGGGVVPRAGYAPTMYMGTTVVADIFLLLSTRDDLSQSSTVPGLKGTVDHGRLHNNIS